MLHITAAPAPNRVTCKGVISDTNCRFTTLSAEHSLPRIAFPAISTGIYRYPPEEAARIAVQTAAAFLSSEAIIDEVIFCCFDSESLARHEEAIAALS